MCFRRRIQFLLSCEDDDKDESEFRPSPSLRHQHDSLSWSQRVMERFGQKLHREFRRHVFERRDGLDEVAEVVGGKILMTIHVLVQDE